MDGKFLVNNKDNYTVYGEHKDKFYYVYLDFFPKDNIFFRFYKRTDMEQFIYGMGYERYIYISSNGKSFLKTWEYIQSELDDWKEWNETKNKKSPDKYTFDDFMCGHFVKER